ncbi:MAG: ATP-binding protein [Planctomycetota bacterium]|nr:ATP-binding protein [Planctomycetota bacterium]
MSLIAAIRERLRLNPIVGLLGARQVGKTTLALQVARASRLKTHVFDLEDPDDLARLARPMDALRDLEGLVVIDEVHRRPDLFQVLRVLADRRPVRTRFLVLGSASIDLLKQSSESLAGRIAYFDLAGFGLDEVGVEQWRKLWLRGGFPRSFLARSEASSTDWRRDYSRTFLERDVRSFGIEIEPAALQRFWRMLAHYHGQVWNASEFGRAFGVADNTVRRYLDTLCGLLVVRRLSPWFENVGKRQVKAPKVYIADSGLLHLLLNVTTGDDLAAHPKVGASWEGFAMDAVVRRLGVRWEQCYFWRAHTGAELDLFVPHGKRRIGFEFKHTSAPELSRSMLSALEVLRLNEMIVVHRGEHAFSLHEKIRAVPLARLKSELKPLS